MKKSKLFLIILLLLITSTCFASVACNNKNGKKESEIQGIYLSYVEQMENIGEEPVSYFEWLNIVKNINGIENKSAYEIWLSRGHYGTENDFLTWLKNGEKQSSDIKIYNVLLDDYYQSGNLLSYTVIYGEYFELPIPKKRGYDFLGWYEGNEKIENGIWERREGAVFVGKWKVSEEMSNYEFFTTSFGECVITGIKDSLITELVIPECVTRIKEHVFDDCLNLRKVTFNAYQLSMRENEENKRLFERCYKLVEVVFGERVYSVPEEVFSYCTNLTTVKISDSVIDIGDSAFFYCSNLSNIDIPDSVENIGNSAFGNSGLRHIKLGRNVKCIGIGAFSKTFLQEIVFPENVECIKRGAFSECNSLEEIKIENKIKNIADNLFYNCKKLSNVIIGESVISVGEKSFFGCDALREIIIPENVISIGSEAFECNSLNLFTVSKNNTAFSSEDGILYDKNKSKIICVPMSKNGEVNIPEGVSRIEDHTFENRVYLTKVVIPDSVVSIGNRAFANCYGLLEVKNSVNIVNIGEGAFFGCRNLTSITIPKNVTFIEWDCFYNCYGLTEIVNLSKVIVKSVYAKRIIDDETQKGEFISYKDYIFYKYEGEHYLCCYTGEAMDLVLPKQEECGFSYAIKKYAFSYLEINSIIIPKNIKNIENKAFDYSDNPSEDITIYFETEEPSADWSKNWKYGFFGTFVWGYEC